MGKCRFSDCRHQTEPGCAIKEAIANGELSRERWESYMGLKTEAAYSDDKAAFLRQKQQRNKNIAKLNRQKKSESRKYGGDKR